jgi:hypothetical protein
MSTTTRLRRWTAAVAILLLLGGCAGTRRNQVTFHDPNMDFSLIQTAAVLPFDNLTPSTTAGERVRDVFMTMLQATGGVYVLPPGEIGRGLSRSGIDDPSAPTSEQVVAFAKIVGADAVISGVVREYGEARSGAARANLVSVSIRLMETETGRVVFSAESTKGGIKTSDRLFGGGGEPMNPVTVEAVNELLDRMFAGQ